MKKLLTYLFIVAISVAGVKAQQDPLYTQYMFNPLNYNPAYAGNKSILSAALVYRNQWAGIQGAPKIVTFAAHSPLKNKNMGVGFEVTNDKIGPTNNISVQASYAYRIRVSKISKGKLGFGVKAGVYNSSINWNEINYKDAGDGLVLSAKQSYTTPIFDFGLYYHKTNRVFAGATFQNLNSPSQGIKYDGRSTAEESKLYSAMVLTYGRIVEVNDRVVFRPSFLFRSTFRTSPVLDVNMSLLFDGVFWAGLSYRTTNVVAAILEYEITDQIKLGYSYDYDFNGLSTFTTGSHEIFIGFNYNVFKSRMRSPRYYF
ncbi:MAG: type IX secretion system membrane protein PorP/SprF [Vicingaceae bacterium]